MLRRCSLLKIGGSIDEAVQKSLPSYTCFLVVHMEEMKEAWWSNCSFKHVIRWIGYEDRDGVASKVVQHSRQLKSPLLSIPNKTQIASQRLLHHLLWTWNQEAWTFVPVTRFLSVAIKDFDPSIFLNNIGGIVSHSFWGPTKSHERSPA